MVLVKTFSENTTLLLLILLKHINSDDIKEEYAATSMKSLLRTQYLKSI